MFDMYKKAPELLYQRSYECGGKGAKRLRRLAPISLHILAYFIMPSNKTENSSTKSEYTIYK